MKLSVKAETINQFKLLQHVKENFNEEANLKIKLMDENTIMVRDDKGEYCYLEMQPDGTIEREFHLGDDDFQECILDEEMEHDME